MKTLLGTFKYTLPAAIVLMTAFVLSCESQKASRSSSMAGGSKIEIRKEGITLHPTVKLNDTQTKEFDNILATYGKNVSNYRFDTLENGKVVKTQGSSKIIGSVVAERASAAKEGESGVEDNSACPDAGWCPPPLEAAKPGEEPADAKALQTHLAEFFRKIKAQ